MDGTQWMTLIANLGFPIVVALILLFRIEPVMKELRDAVKELTMRRLELRDAIRELTDLVKQLNGRFKR